MVSVLSVNPNGFRIGDGEPDTHASPADGRIRTGSKQSNLRRLTGGLFKARRLNDLLKVAEVRARDEQDECDGAHQHHELRARAADDRFLHRLYDDLEIGVEHRPIAAKPRRYRRSFRDRLPLPCFRRATSTAFPAHTRNSSTSSKVSSATA